MCPSLSACGLLDISTENVGIDDCGGPPADDALALAEPYERRPLFAGGGPPPGPVSGGLSAPLASAEFRFRFKAPITRKEKKKLAQPIPPKKKIVADSILGNLGEHDYYSHTYEKLQLCQFPCRTVFETKRRAHGMFSSDWPHSTPKVFRFPTRSAHGTWIVS